MSNTQARCIGYLRVSTAEQDVEKNKADILKLANDKKLGNVDWVEETWSKRRGQVSIGLGSGHANSLEIND